MVTKRVEPVGSRRGASLVPLEDEAAFVLLAGGGGA